MESKTVISSVLIMSLVLTQIQVEATSLCCPTKNARNMFITCMVTISIPPYCLSKSKCKSVSGDCPPGYQNDIHENSGDAVNEYCKLGCASSVCGVLTTLQNSEASINVLSEAVEQCTKACSTVCSKGSPADVKSA